MNKEISTMIQLQRFLDRMLEAKEEVARCGKSITYWKQRVDETEKTLAVLENRIKAMKSAIKQSEIELSQKDEKAKKLEIRRTAVKNERELSAIENEKQTLDGERGVLEESILTNMEELETKTAEETQLSDELAEMRTQAEKDIRMLQGKILEQQGILEENKKSFDSMITELSPQFKAKFQKLAESGSGKAIVRVEGETCEGCHFQIPLNFIIDAAKNDRIVNCTHCGRFIYKT